MAWQKALWLVAQRWAGPFQFFFSPSGGAGLMLAPLYAEGQRVPHSVPQQPDRDGGLFSVEPLSFPASGGTNYQWGALEDARMSRSGQEQAKRPQLAVRCGASRYVWL